MIGVPRVVLAGLVVGPVFTRRRDQDFDRFMSSMTDKSARGSLGGSALRCFRVTVDYPRAVARFEVPR